MNKKKQDVRPRTFGLALLLVVFLVLCLMTFAAISIAEARNDLAGAEVRLEKTVALNTAANEAEQNIRDFTGEAAMDPEHAQSSIEFSVSIDETDELDVSLELVTDGGTPTYAVTRWQVVSNADWVPQDHLEVLPDGEIGW